MNHSLFVTILLLWMVTGTFEFGMFVFGSLSIHTGDIEDKIGCGVMIVIPLAAAIVTILLLIGVLPSYKWK